MYKKKTQNKLLIVFEHYDSIHTPSRDPSCHFYYVVCNAKLQLYAKGLARQFGGGGVGGEGSTLKIKALQACNIPATGYFQCKENHFETRPFHAKFEENR